MANSPDPYDVLKEELWHALADVRAIEVLWEWAHQRSPRYQDALRRLWQEARNDLDAILSACRDAGIEEDDIALLNRLVVQTVDIVKTHIERGPHGEQFC